MPACAEETKKSKKARTTPLPTRLLGTGLVWAAPVYPAEGLRGMGQVLLIRQTEEREQEKQFDRLPDLREKALCVLFRALVFSLAGFEFPVRQGIGGLLLSRAGSCFPFSCDIGSFSSLAVILDSHGIPLIGSKRKPAAGMPDCSLSLWPLGCLGCRKGERRGKKHARFSCPRREVYRQDSIVRCQSPP